MKGIFIINSEKLDSFLESVRMVRDIAGAPAVVSSNTEHISVDAFGSTGRRKYRRRTFRPLAFRTLMIYS